MSYVLSLVLLKLFSRVPAHERTHADSVSLKQISGTWSCTRIHVGVDCCCCCCCSSFHPVHLSIVRSFVVQVCTTAHYKMESRTYLTQEQSSAKRQKNCSFFPREQSEKIYFGKTPAASIAERGLFFALSLSLLSLRSDIIIIIIRKVLSIVLPLFHYYFT